NRCHTSNGYRELRARYQGRAETRCQYLSSGGNAAGRRDPADGPRQCWSRCGADVAPRQCRTIASVDTRTPRRRMRRAACGDAEISRELRHFAHEADEAIVPAAGNPRLALLFDRTADFIAARQAINVRAVFRQPRQKMR